MSDPSPTPPPASHILVMTVLGADHPGIVDRLAGLIRDHGGNWLESRMARLCGQFAGIVEVRVPSGAIEALSTQLAALSDEGLTVSVGPSDSETASPPRRRDATRMQVEILCPDRPGILRELTGLLAARAVNVEELSTRIVPAQFSGEPLFEARVQLALPSAGEREALREAIEALATDLALDLSIQTY